MFGKSKRKKHKRLIRKFRMIYSHGIGTHTRQEWRDLKVKYGNICLACKQPCNDLRRDHIFPISLGGSSSITNIQPLCQPCNSLKGSNIIDYRPF